MCVCACTHPVALICVLCAFADDVVILLAARAPDLVQSTVAAAKLTLIVIIPIPILLFASRIFQKHIKKAFYEVRNQVSKMNEFVQEQVTGMHIVQAFGRERVESEKFAQINELHKKANIDSIMAFSIFFPVVEMLSATSVALLLWLGYQ